MFTITKPMVLVDDQRDAVIHMATSWQVATSPTFDNDSILINDSENTVDLLSTKIDLPLTKDVVYYVRDKMHYSSGNVIYDDTGWSMPIAITKGTNNMYINSTIIGTPRLSVNFNKNDAPLGGFEVKCTDYTLFTGVGTHHHTDWYIEDLAGNTIWKREKDKYNHTSIRVPRCVLLKNKTYIIKAKYTSTTNKSSNYGKLTITTSNYELDTSCTVDYKTETMTELLRMLTATSIYNTL